MDHNARSSAASHGVSFAEALRVWVRIALLSFGGPAGQIAVMHRILVDEKRWISDNRFLHVLNYCMLLPGPEAQQTATYVGWLLHGTRGGLAAGLLFILPGFISIMALSVLYVTLGHSGVVAGVFYGLKPAVIAIVIEAVVRVARRSLRNRVMISLAGAAFVALFFLGASFPVVVLWAGAIGFVGGAMRPEVFDITRHRAVGGLAEREALIHDDMALRVRPTLGRALRVIAVWSLVWFAPMAALWAWLGPGHTLVKQGVFFSRVAMVTFGGAYAVLAYVAQQAVEVHDWLTPGQMLDGLGMAETTPGPLILVLQFVGFLGAHRHPADLPPLLSAVLGGCLAVWVTFAPCFLWIFLGAPYVERLRGNHRLSGALSAITAAVVGVIGNLAAWFALHTLFATVTPTHAGPLRLLVPDVATLDVPAAVLAIAAGVMLLALRWNMLVVIAVCAAAGLAFKLIA